MQKCAHGLSARLSRRFTSMTKTQNLTKGTIKMIKTYILAARNKTTGAIVPFQGLAPVALAQAEKARRELLALVPSATIYVINQGAE